MHQRHEDFAPISNSRAVRTQLGGALREQHNLTEPLSESLVGLLESMVNLAGREPGSHRGIVGPARAGE
jgi:hypothetical protein